MAMNKIQFQHGLPLQEFMQQYGTEEQCEQAVFNARWPKGWKCPRCEGERHSCTHNGRKLWGCLECGYQCSSIVGTVFEHTKPPLMIWFLAIYLMMQSKNAVSASELKRQVGTTYERHVVGGGKSAVQHSQFHWVNTILGHLKTALNGTYHTINHAKYAHRYLAEFTYRFNRRFKLSAMTPRLHQAVVATKPIKNLRLFEVSN